MGACESHEHSHKELSRKAILGGLAAVLTGIGLSTLGDTAAFAATSYKTSLKATSVRVGSAKTVTVRGISMLITQPKAGVFRAFKNQCTHQAVPLGSQSLYSNSVMCPEHHATFNANTGAVISGPAFRSLTKYSASVKNGYIYVTV